jgi:hypothetical protein
MPQAPRQDQRPKAPPSPLIVVVRRRSANYAPQTYTFIPKEAETRCYITLGKFQPFSPARGPQQSALTVLTVNDGVQLKVESAQYSLPRALARQAIHQVVDRGRDALVSRLVGLSMDLDRLRLPNPEDLLAQVRQLPYRLRRRLFPKPAVVTAS